jgi:hypothetical protein
MGIGVMGIGVMGMGSIEGTADRLVRLTALGKESRPGELLRSFNPAIET